jgi:adenylyl/guanylyl cyclase-like protein with sensor domain/SMODS domain-containing protein
MIDNNLEPLVADYAKTRLSPTRAERTAISTRYDQLQEFLQGRTFQSGSYARFTSTTPVNDLDVIYVLPDELLKQVRTALAAVDPAKLDIRRIVDSLAEELRKHYGTTATVKAQPHSVGIFFGKKHEFSIDVVPAAPTEGDKFWIPEVARTSVARRRELYRSWQAQVRTQTPPGPNWIKSHPKGYITQASTLDQSTEGRFRKAAKVVKKWRWSCKRANDAFRLKSFHLELAVTRWFQRNPNSRCIEGIRGVVSELDELIASPQFRDLADEAQFVDQYVTTLTDADRALLRRQFEHAQFLWAEVERAKSADEVRKALEAFLGVAGSPLPASSSAAPSKRLLGIAPQGERDPGEEFLCDFGVPFREQHHVKVNAEVSKDGFRPFKLLERHFPLFKLRKLEFYVEDCDVPQPFEVRWKVKNTGGEATRKGALRGQIYGDEGRLRRKESTLYWGNHYVECYVIKDGVCVAADHIDVPIGPRE